MNLLPRAVTFAIVGESLIRYTEDVVLPRIDAALAEIDRTAAAPACSTAIAPSALRRPSPRRNP